MTDEERMGRAKELLALPIASMCQEIGEEYNRDLQWDGWRTAGFFIRLAGERREVEVPQDWLADYPEASEGYQLALQHRLREKLREWCTP